MLLYVISPYRAQGLATEAAVHGDIELLRQAFMMDPRWCSLQSTRNMADGGRNVNSAS